MILIGQNAQTVNVAAMANYKIVLTRIYIYNIVSMVTTYIVTSIVNTCITDDIFNMTV